jgi:hypothetical protein
LTTERFIAALSPLPGRKTECGSMPVVPSGTTGIAVAVRRENSTAAMRQRLAYPIQDKASPVGQ